MGLSSIIGVLWIVCSAVAFLYNDVDSKVIDDVHRQGFSLISNYGDVATKVRLLMGPITYDMFDVLSHALFNQRNLSLAFATSSRCSQSFFTSFDPSLKSAVNETEKRLVGYATKLDIGNEHAGDIQKIITEWKEVSDQQIRKDNVSMAAIFTKYNDNVNELNDKYYITAILDYSEVSNRLSDLKSRLPQDARWNCADLLGSNQHIGYRYMQKIHNVVTGKPFLPPPLGEPDDGEQTIKLTPSMILSDLHDDIEDLNDESRLSLSTGFGLDYKDFRDRLNSARLNGDKRLLLLNAGITNGNLLNDYGMALNAFRDGVIKLVQEAANALELNGITKHKEEVAQLIAKYKSDVTPKIGDAKVDMGQLIDKFRGDVSDAFDSNDDLENATNNLIDSFADDATEKRTDVMDDFRLDSRNIGKDFIKLYKNSD